MHNPSVLTCISCGPGRVSNYRRSSRGFNDMTFPTECDVGRGTYTTSPFRRLATLLAREGSDGLSAMLLPRTSEWHLDDIGTESALT